MTSSPKLGHASLENSGHLVLALFDMLENAGDEIGIRDFASHAKIPAAFRTHTQLDTEHPVEPVHPSHGCRGRFARVLKVSALN